MAEVNYSVVESLGVLSVSEKGWTKELNLISWNGAAPKYDIRDWSPDHNRIGKGITLSNDEAMLLMSILKNKLDVNRIKAFE